jgi:phosphoribosylformylglycinamidine synthase
MGERGAMLGADVDVSDPLISSARALLWGEAQGRVLVSTARVEDVLSVAASHGIAAKVIGSVTAEQRLVIRAGARSLDTPLSPLADAYFDAIPALMQRAATATA